MNNFVILVSRVRGGSNVSDGDSMSSSISSKSIGAKLIESNSVAEQDMTYFGHPDMLDHMQSRREGEKLIFIQMSFDPAE